MKKYLGKKSLVITGIILLFYVFVALFASMLAPHDPNAVDSASRLIPYSPDYPLGTDEFGRDILSRLLLGLRPSLIIATASTALAMVFGTALGVAAGCTGGKTEQMIMRLTDIVLCFPPMLLAVMIVGFWGAGTRNLIITLCITYTPTFIRLTYSAASKVWQMEYIEAQRTLGASWLRLVSYGVLPNISSQIIVQCSLTFGSAILLEAGLSFLGMGVVPPTPSLGVMIASAQGYLQDNLMMLVWPSATLVVLSLAINIFGDSLRDVLDPRVAKR